MSKKILVGYTDGSSRPNPGFAGYGIFGYVLSHSKKNKSINFMLDTNVIFSKNGLINKAYFTDPELKKSLVSETMGADVGKVSHDKIKEIMAGYDIPFETETMIVEIGCLNSEDGTNNQAELMGAVRLLERGLEKIKDLEEVLLISDSQYVLKGIRGSLNKWSQNNWRTSTGEPVKNQDLWKRIYASIETLKASNIQVRTKWTKGHDQDPGNLIVDMLAGLGTAFSNSQFEMNADPFKEILYQEETPVTQFKKELEVMHVSQFYKHMYFSTREIDITGNNIFLASPKNQHDIGKRNLNNSYGLVRNDPLGTYITAQTDFADLVGQFNVRCSVNLDTIKSNKLFSKIVDKIGLSDILFKAHQRGMNKMLMPDGTPIIEELGRDFCFIMDTIDVFETLQDAFYILDNRERGVGNIIDITDHFIYENCEKLEPVTDLSIKFSDTSIDLGDEIEMPHHVLISNPVLYIGKDTPPYSVFKHLGSRIQKVHLITKEGTESNLSTFIVVIEYLNDNNDTAYIAHTNIEGKFLVKLKPAPTPDEE